MKFGPFVLGAKSTGVRIATLINHMLNEYGGVPSSMRCPLVQVLIVRPRDVAVQPVYH